MELFIGAQNDLLYVIDGRPNYFGEGPIPKEFGPNVVAGPFNLNQARTDRELQKLLDFINNMKS